MVSIDINTRILPWLQRWSVDSLAHADDWLGRMSIKPTIAMTSWFTPAKSADTLYLLESGLVRLYLHHTRRQGA